MSTLYSVLPLEPDLFAFLDDAGCKYPKSSGRNPTLREVRQALALTPGISVAYHVPQFGGTWQATVEGVDGDTWTSINALDYQGESERHTVYFAKGWLDLIIEVVHSLSRSAGPLVLIPDTGNAPIVVEPTQPLDHFLNNREHHIVSVGNIDGRRKTT